MAGKYSRMVGRNPKVIGDLFQGDSAGDSSIQVEDMGAYPLHGTVPEKLPAHIRQADNGEAAKATVG